MRDQVVLPNPYYKLSRRSCPMLVLTLAVSRDEGRPRKFNGKREESDYVTVVILDELA